MPQLRIAAFNVENLFNRYVAIHGPGPEYGRRVQLVGVTSIDYQGRALSEAVTQVQRNNTARAILDCKPDILAVAEVENLWTLRCFNDEYLSNYFDRMVLVEGNDGRGIDIGLCIRYGCTVTVGSIRTHIDEVNPNGRLGRVHRYYSVSRNEIVVDGPLFSRDCLEVDIDAYGKQLTFLVNHFKSQDDRKESDTLRNEQAKRVASLAANLKSSGRLPIVLGDLNEDWSEKDTLKPLRDLVIDGTLADPLGNGWTYCYSIANKTSRLDYILIDGSLRNSVVSKGILRKGITLKCESAGERYPTVGYVGTEASDHCPVFVSLDL